MRKYITSRCALLLRLRLVPPKVLPFRKAGRAGSNESSTSSIQHQKRRPFLGVFFGAADRGRTGTGFIPRDFKSLASAYSTTAAYNIELFDLPQRPFHSGRKGHGTPAKRRSVFVGKGGAAERVCLCRLRERLEAEPAPTRVCLIHHSGI